MLIRVPREGEPWGEDWLDHVTDEQIIAGYLEDGFDRDYAVYMVDVLRGREDGSELE